MNTLKSFHQLSAQPGPILKVVEAPKETPGIHAEYLSRIQEEYEDQGQQLIKDTLKLREMEIAVRERPNNNILVERRDKQKKEV